MSFFYLILGQNISVSINVKQDWSEVANSNRNEIPLLYMNIFLPISLQPCKISSEYLDQNIYICKTCPISYFSCNFFFIIFFFLFFNKWKTMLQDVSFVLPMLIVILVIKCFQRKVFISLPQQAIMYYLTLLY